MRERPDRIGDHWLVTQLTPIAVSYPEAAKLLQVSERTVRRLVAEGVIRVRRVGRCVRIQVSELERYLNSKETE